MSQGLLFYAFDTGDEDIRVIDLVGHYLGKRVPFGSTVSNTVNTQWGQTAGWNGDSWFWAVDSVIQAATAGGGYSFACAESHSLSSQIANARPFGRTANNNASPFLNWGFQTDASGNNMLCFMNAASGLVQIGPTWTGDNKYQFNTLVGVATSTTTASFYANAALVGSTTSGSGAWASSNSGDAIIVSGVLTNTTPTHYWLGSIYYGAFWNRPLSADEASYLHNDPYCFLLPPEPMGVPVISTGSHPQTVTAAQTLFKPTQAGVLAEKPNATIGQTLFRISQHGVLQDTPNATISQTLRGVTQAGVLAEKPNVTASQTLFKPTQRGQLNLAQSAHIAQTLFKPTQAASVNNRPPPVVWASTDDMRICRVTGPILPRR